MSQKKTFFISTVRLFYQDGATSIPTVLWYDGGKPLIGYDAIEKSGGSLGLNAEFKIELGKTDPVSQYPIKLETAGGGRRTPFGLARDFTDVLLQHVDECLAVCDLASVKCVLVAEPIAMGAGQGINDSWLPNYRNSLKRILTRKFDQIDFLPEPFAVFQYYRYGIRHPLVAQRTKHVALVLDFGGGTFDVSVIETTAQGDISQSGRNSRPLTASSIPVGGFFINRSIVNNLLYRHAGKQVERHRLKQAWTHFDQLQYFDEYELSQARSDFKDLIAI
jgi:hypothetical protein